jgi:hypothetical protein
VGVRGDSLRDLYAKGLALLGLGFLAAVGALFDYWPVSSELPRVARALTVPPASTAPVLMLASTEVAPPISRGSRRQEPRAAVPEAAPTPLDQGAPSLPVSAMSLPPSGLGWPIALAAPSDAPPPALVDTPTLPPPTDIAWDEPPATAAIDLIAATGPARDDGSAIGYVTDAFKKTGRTLVKTGAKTGDAIRDVLVMFGGAFRAKVLRF